MEKSSPREPLCENLVQPLSEPINITASISTPAETTEVTQIDENSNSMSTKPLNPALSPLQARAAKREYKPVPRICMVTGGTGFVGIRLVEMLVERGAEKVIAFDIVPKEKAIGAWDSDKIVYMRGDITNYEDVSNAVKGVDCVWHLAAAVGPFHPQELYERVNYNGTLNVIKACNEHNVMKLVFSSSPSTRFKGSLFSRPDVDGLTEDQMPKLPLDHYMQKYAETKAMGEIAVQQEVKRNPKFLGVSVAPHQVYGPRDNLFLPNMLEAAGSGRLRIFGKGDNRICFTHVDNYCHALIIAELKLFIGSPVLGKFYIATDGDTHPEPKAYCVFWKEMDKAVVGMGFPSLTNKFHYPFWFLYPIALFCEMLGRILRTTFKLNVFNVFVLTMNRWFDISAIENELDFQPIIGFKEGWEDSIEWFRLNWLPTFQKGGLVGLAAKSQAKIDVQAAGRNW